MMFYLVIVKSSNSLACCVTDSSCLVMAFEFGPLAQLYFLRNMIILTQSLVLFHGHSIRGHPGPHVLKYYSVLNLDENKKRYASTCRMKQILSVFFAVVYGTSRIEIPSSAKQNYSDNEENNYIVETTVL